MKDIFKFSAIIFIIFIIYCCKKEDTTILPYIISESATDLTNTTAILNGTIDANKSSTELSFEYGLTTLYGQTAQVQNPVSGNSSAVIKVPITGLKSGETYHYRLKAVNSKGSTYGDDMLFTTSAKDLSNTNNIMS